MADSQLNTHQVDSIPLVKDILSTDQNFAAGLVEILLSSGSRRACLERFMAMLHKLLPDARFYLFTAHGESSMTLLSARPEIAASVYDHQFAALSDKSHCFVSHLNRSAIWQQDYAEFFPDIEQCLLFSVSVNTRYYTLMIDCPYPALRQIPWLQTFCYTYEIVRSVSGYMTFIELHYEKEEFALQQEKFASLGRLAAGVAHEINNPLAFIMSNFSTLSTYFSQLKTVIQQAGVVQDESLKYLLEDSDAIISETFEGLTRIQSIVASLNVYEHESGVSQRQVDLRDVVSTALSMVQGELKLRAGINCQIPDEPLYLRGYPARLQQVVIHLVVNALQSIAHDTGIVSLSMGIDSESHHPGKKRVFLIIEDNGKGISESDLQHIFDPFFTTKRVGNGAGLGLSVAKEIIEEHHGQISVESVQSKGTTVRLQFPGLTGLTGKNDAV